MKPSQNHHVTRGTADTAEETLRVISNLPAPEGLVDRVQTRLRTAPRSVRVLNWQRGFTPNAWSYANVVRGAAAAAIVCVVAGGGWQIYSHVQPAPTAKDIVMPAPAGPSRGFSTAGEVHTPDPRPVLTHQIAAGPGQHASKNPAKKSGADRAVKAGKVATPPAATSLQ